MSRFDPRGKANRALIVGVSEYDHTKPSDGVPGNLSTVHDNRTGLNGALHRGAVFGEGQITVCPSPAHDGFWEALHRAAQEAKGLLLFYFAGHGILPVEGNELYLQMRNARVVPGGRNAFPGAAAITHVLDVLANSKAERIVVILDCCYAGNAAEAWQKMRDPDKKRKILLLMSVQSNRLITAEDGGKGTPFTRELVRLLEQQRDLSLLTLYRELRECLQILTIEGDRQEPQGSWEPGEDVLMRSKSPTWPRSGGKEPIPDAAGEGPPGALRTRRRIAFTSITCLALLAAAGGVRLIWNYAHNDGPPSPGHTASSSPTASISLSAKENMESFARLKDAQANKVTWIVGVKRNQPGLSEQKGGKWSGKEIEYAEVILDALGIEKFSYRGVGTDMRAEELDDKGVDMFIGTYGISPERKRGTSEDPAVIFAGPYFDTYQKIMLEHYPGSNNGSEARIRGKRKVIYSISDIPEDARLCVVKGSSAEKYLQHGETKWPYIDHPTDYNLCVDGLDKIYDAVLTDEVILQNFKKGNKYFIANDRFGKTEKYGIGLNVNSIDVKREICKKMIDTLDKRNGIYDKLGGKDYSASDLDECH